MRITPLFAALAVTVIATASAAGPMEDAASVGEHETMKLELLNQGPIGARGYVRQETRYPLAGYFIGDTIEVRHTFPGGPAEGRLRVGDVITGVNGQPFGTRRFRPAVPAYHAKQNPKVMAEGLFEVQAYRELGEAIDAGEAAGAVADAPSHRQTRQVSRARGPWATPNHTPRPRPSQPAQPPPRARNAGIRPLQTARRSVCFVEMSFRPSAAGRPNGSPNRARRAYHIPL